MTTLFKDNIEFRQSPSWPTLHASACGQVMYPGGKTTFGSRQPKGYRRVNYNAFNGAKPQNLRVHRVVMDAWVGPNSLDVDHINGIKDDNRIENLRYATKMGNSANLKGHREGTFSSKYRGVTTSKRWLAQITDNNKNKLNLGSFNTEEKAARAYDDACVAFGRPRVNFPV